MYTRALAFQCFCNRLRGINGLGAITNHLLRCLAMLGFSVS